MPLIGIDLRVHGANFMASATVYGPPGPPSYWLFLRAMMLKVGAGEPGAVAIGVKGWSADEASADKYGNPGLPMRIRTATDSFTRRDANNFMQIACYDEARGSLHVRLVVETACQPQDAADLAEKLSTEIMFNPCLGGVVATVEARPLDAASVIPFLYGCRVLVDRTAHLRRLAGDFERSELQVLVDVHNRGLGTPNLADDAYRAALEALGWAIAVPLGYRVLGSPVVGRPGARNPELPHLFAETVTGLASYLSPHALRDDPAQAFWHPASTETFFIMETR